MQKILLIAALLTISAATRAEHRGRVFDDRNANGIFDKGDKPLKGVKVSDGLNVAETGADGSFTLPGHERERFVFVTTPSGYRTRDTHYHRINGTTRSYEFALTPFSRSVGRKGEHRFIQISDTEIFNTQNHEDWVDNVRKYATAEKVAFVVHTGDICYENGLKSHIELMNSQNLDCPMYYCIGNHDLVKGKYGEELFESIYGPVYYSFEVGNTHYLVTPMSGGDYRPGYTTADVCRWLKNDLAHVKPGMSVVAFNHDLLTYGDRFVYKGGPDEEVDLDAHGLKAWIYGHWHINYVKKQGNVLAISTGTLDKGGIDHSIGAFRVIDIDSRGDISTQLRYTYLDRNLCIAAPGDTVAPGQVPLTVNTYTSEGPTLRVSYTLAAGGRTVVKKRALQASTDWSWTGTLDLPESYRGQNLQLSVEAVYADGRTAKATRTLTCGNEAETPRPTADWTNLLGNPAHAGVALKAPAAPLRMAWTRNVGANLYMCSPVVADGRVFVASVDEDLKGRAHLYALKAQDGSPLWEYRVRNSVKNTIVAAGGVVLAQDVEGWLYAIDAQSGTLAWEKKLPTPGLPALIEGIVASGDTVFAGTGKSLTAFEAATGRELWRNNDWNSREGTTSTLTLGNGVLVTGSQWNALFANDARTGRMLWSASDNGLRHRGASPAAHGGLLYLISERSFFIIDSRTGRTVTRREMPFNVDVTSTPLLLGQLIVFGTADKGLAAIDRETHELKWTTETGAALAFTAPYTRKPSATIETSPVAAGGIIYAAASDGALYAVSPKDGSVVWKHATGAPLFGTPAVSGNTLFFTDFGGNVYAFTTRTE